MSAHAAPTAPVTTPSTLGATEITPIATAVDARLVRRSVRDLSVDDKEVSSLFARVMDWLSESSWEQEVRAREAYLAQARDAAELEHRMRKLDGSLVHRARALR